MNKEISNELLDPMTEMQEGEIDRQFVTALARGLELLRCFEPKESLLGNLELAKKTGLPRPTITRLTYTLTRLGYLKKDPESGKYQLDIGVLSFGYQLLNNLAIKNVARPLMEEMANYAEAAVAMAARDRLQMVYLDVVHGSANLTMRRPVGSYLPIYASSMGRACLAAMPKNERNFILEHVKQKYSNEWDEINQGLDEAFQCFEEFGYCLSIGDWHREVNSIAVPLINHRDELMVFNCGGPNFQLSEERLKEDIAPRMIHMVNSIKLAHY